MRIFLTGGTGYIGAAVLDALIRGGHEVTALVRDNEKAAHVTARGGLPVVGSLGEPASYRAAADAQDGYVHTAFDGRSGLGPVTDRIALETILAAAKRPRTVGSHDAEGSLRHLHLGTVGARTCPGAGRGRRPDQPDFDGRLAARERRARARRGVGEPAHDGGPAGRGLRRRQRARRRSLQVGDERSGPRDRRRQQPLAARLRS